MHASQSLADSETVSVPEPISSSTGKLVYLYLGVAGEATVGDLAADLELGELTASAVLATLCEKSVVERRGDVYVAVAG